MWYELSPTFGAAAACTLAAAAAVWRAAIGVSTPPLCHPIPSLFHAAPTDSAIAHCNGGVVCSFPSSSCAAAAQQQLVGQRCRCWRRCLWHCLCHSLTALILPPSQVKAPPCHPSQASILTAFHTASLSSFAARTAGNCTAGRRQPCSGPAQQGAGTTTPLQHWQQQQQMSKPLVLRHGTSSPLQLQLWSPCSMNKFFSPLLERFCPLFKHFAQ